MFRYILLILSSCSLLAMDPTLAQGQTRLKFTFSSLDAASYFDFEEIGRDIDLRGRPAEFSLDTYTLEYTYGWSNDIAVVMRSRSEDRVLGSATDQVNNDGISGYYLGLRQRIGFGQGTHIYSETGVSTGENDEGPLPLSAGGTNWYALFSYQQDLLPSRAGFEMDFGYVFAGGGAEDEYRFGSKLHLDFLEVVGITLGYEVVESRKDTKTDYSPLVWPTERGFQDLSASFNRQLGRSLVVEAAYVVRLKGRNQFDTDGFRVSLGWWFGG